MKRIDWKGNKQNKVIRSAAFKRLPVTNRTGLSDPAFRRNHNEPQRGLTRPPAGLVVEPGGRDLLFMERNGNIYKITFFGRVSFFVLPNKCGSVRNVKR